MVSVEKEGLIWISALETGCTVSWREWDSYNCVDTDSHINVAVLQWKKLCCALLCPTFLLLHHSCDSLTESCTLSCITVPTRSTVDFFSWPLGGSVPSCKHNIDITTLHKAVMVNLLVNSYPFRHPPDNRAILAFIVFLASWLMQVQFKLSY